MPISIPVIDMVEIGAGGGSLAHVDGLRQIRVGPESAGSEPGPACYGRGGQRPAVTDADLILGKLDADDFAGGAFTLDRENAQLALETAIGTPLDMDAQTAAFGLAEVVDENMANAARVHAVENGEDLSEYTMIAFGGAAPLHAGRLCEKLGVKRCLVPKGAGVGSAIGFLRAPFSFEANRSVYMRLSDFAPETIRDLLAELAHEASGFVQNCAPEATISTDYKVYMRYTGQGWEIPITLPKSQAQSPDAATFKRLFEADYAALFGRVVDGMDVEITVWSANATTPAPQRPPMTQMAPNDDAQVMKTRALFDPAQGTTTEAAVFRREDLPVGTLAQGPAILTEAETTVIIPATRQAHVQPDGTLDITLNSSTKSNATLPREVAQQVMWNRLISIVEEQAQALIRTAFSTSVREAGDLSAGIYNAAGLMLAQAVTGTPGHVNAMADAVGHFIRRIGRENICDGDVYITNDPWEGTGHLHDFTVVTPSFRNDTLVGFFACTAHVVDVGGRGFGADAASIYEEGLQVPILKFIDRGTVDQTLLRLIRGNVREPDQLVGDLYALTTCNQIGHLRLQDMMEEFALTDIEEIASFILENSRAATLKRIADLPRKSAKGEMRIDGFSAPVDLRLKLEVLEDRITCDFDGTSGLDPKGINVPMVYTKAYACYALKCAIAPDIPNNAASLAPFEVTAPANSIVNAQHPAPVALRHIIGHMIPDTVFDALDKILPETVPAEGAGCLCNFQVSTRPRSDIPAPMHARRAEVLTFNSGGAGARATLDGLNATAFPSGVMTMPIEATEHAGPVIIWRKELRPDSGGAGKYRGGLGQLMEVGAVEGHEFDFQAMFDRVDHPARGRAGGESGAATQISQDDGTPMRGKGKQFVGHGRRVVLALPGGAGYGNKAERSPADLRRDLLGGYISPAAAQTVYGLSPQDIAQVLEAVKNGETLP
jgi:N-methylhydantoinase B/oxoprolinase/acetone carboxylase alpha subunit